MRIMVESAASVSARSSAMFAAMTERRMAKIVGEAQGLGQILVEPECAGDRAAAGCDFEAVS